MLLENNSSGISYSLVYQNGNTVSFSIGNGKNDISYDLLVKILEYAKSNGKSADSFKELLASSIYNGLSSEEKGLLELVKNDSSGVANAQILVSNENEEPDYSLLQKMPTDAYLEEMKNNEEIEFKIRELKKYYRKMDKINGNLPLEELISELQGVSSPLSNIHVTGIELLLQSKLNSPVF